MSRRKSNRKNLRLETCEPRRLLAGPDSPAPASAGDAVVVNQAQSPGVIAAADPSLTNEGAFIRLNSFDRASSNRVHYQTLSPELGSVWFGWFDLRVQANRVDDGAVGVKYSNVDSYDAPISASLSMGVPKPEPVTPGILSLGNQPAGAKSSRPRPALVPPETKATVSSPNESSLVSALSGSPADPSSESIASPQGEGGFETLATSVAFQAVPISSDMLAKVSAPSHLVDNESDDVQFRERLFGSGDGRPSFVFHSETDTRSATPSGSVPTDPTRETRVASTGNAPFSGISVAIHAPQVPLVFEHDTQPFVFTSAPSVTSESQDSAQSELDDNVSDASSLPIGGSEPASVSFDVIASVSNVAQHPAAFLFIVGVLWTRMHGREADDPLSTKRFGRRVRQ
ncbi:MAG: hypothetical protein AAFX06_31510 [Planctomycetota bacterium]